MTIKGYCKDCIHFKGNDVNCIDEFTTPTPEIPLMAGSCSGYEEEKK